MSDLKLGGTVAVITGAGRGIGKSIALAYAREGAAVCCAARTETEIEGAVRDIEASGGKGIAVQTDVTRLDAVENMYNVPKILSLVTLMSRVVIASSADCLHS